MELDEYKVATRQRPAAEFSRKGISELEDFMRLKAHTIVDMIKNNLKFEIAFAFLFLIFDCYVFIFSEHLRLFTFLLIIFCIGFIYYLVKLLKHITSRPMLVVSVKDQLQLYIDIISRFIRLYFQLTMVMMPLIFLLAFISGLLDQTQSSDLNISFTSFKLWLYLVVSAFWSVIMYFFTRWYIKRLYGNHLKKLNDQLRELQDEE